MNPVNVAKAMAETINATLKKVGEVRPEDLAGYDLVGVGSGIYGSRHYKDLFKLIEKMPWLEKDVFVFSNNGY